MEIRDLIYSELKKKIMFQKEMSYIFMCIGTEKIVGDSFGPLVGQKLYNNLKRKSKFHVIGRMKENITYSMVKGELEKINECYVKPYIIAIDAAISEQGNIGKIIVTNQKIRVGEGIRKKRL